MKFLARLFKRRDRSVPENDDTLKKGESLLEVSSEAELSAGSVIRIGSDPNINDKQEFSPPDIALHKGYNILLEKIRPKSWNWKESKEKINKRDMRNSEISSILDEVLSLRRILCSEADKQDAMIADLIGMGPEIIPQIGLAIERTNILGPTGQITENAGILCEAIGKIGGKQAFNTLKELASISSNFWEYTYIGEGAVLGICYLSVKDRKARESLEVLSSEFGMRGKINKLLKELKQDPLKPRVAEETSIIDQSNPFQPVKRDYTKKTTRKKLLKYLEKEYKQITGSLNPPNMIKLLFSEDATKIIKIKSTYKLDIYNLDPGEYIWFEFALGHLDRGGQTCIDIVDAFVFRLNLKSKFSGNFDKLVKLVGEPIPLPSLHKEAIKDYFNEGEGYDSWGPGWRRRSPRVRHII